MAANDNSPLSPYLDLPTTLDPVDAWCKFEEFVKGAGGDEVNLANVRHLFELWRNRGPNDHGVRFTRGIIEAQKYSLVRDPQGFFANPHDEISRANLGDIRRRVQDP